MKVLTVSAHIIDGRIGCGADPGEQCPHPPGGGLAIVKTRSNKFGRGAPFF